ncbi:FAD-dependent oxidoreductase [Ruegeria atlantica]|uniref:FAD-dependent oxidoreductase n=1 Tax=Ruegeria atlantica TaxID=81569 RepID=UPI00147AF71B|nr:FAD-dependent oxidoreductase [Ruegeria atlantica]
MTRIVILGGGFAGLFAAKSLVKHLGKSAEIELISDQNFFVFQPLLPEVAAGSITAAHAISSLRGLLKHVKTRKARVHSIDFEAKTVTVFQGVQRRPTQVAFDQLVIALGQSTDLSRTPGLSDHALAMKTLADASRLRAHVIEKLEHADITQLPEVKQEALTFCVIGGGFSGVETVGEIKELVDRSLKYYPSIDPSEVRVILLEYADNILSELPPRLRQYAAQKLAARGIEVHTSTGVASATGTAIVTTNNDVIGTRTVIATIGNAPSGVVRGMNVRCERGKIVVDRSLAVAGVPDVWALGDCALVPLVEDASAPNEFAPPTAQFAVREARTVAENIRRKLSGQKPRLFSYKSKGAMASLGGKRGVAEVMGLTLTGFPAWLLWRGFYLSFLPGASAKLKVLLNWVLDGLMPRSIVQDVKPENSHTQIAHYRAGDRIFEAGNWADGFYTIISGRVEVRMKDSNTGELTTREIAAGGHFGERLILGESRRAGTVRALDATEVLVMDRQEFLRLASAFPAFQNYFQAYFKDTYGIDWTPAGQAQ